MISNRVVYVSAGIEALEIFFTIKECFKHRTADQTGDKQFVFYLIVLRIEKEESRWKIPKKKKKKKVSERHS